MEKVNENILRVKTMMGLIREEKELPTVTKFVYPTTNNFSAISDDIYQDLILNKIPNVKIKSYSNPVFNSDKTILNSIEFILDIEGVEFKAKFSRDGLFLENNITKNQVRPVWTDKKLFYRNLKRIEKKDENKWMTTEPVLSLEEQIKILKKQFQELYLL